MDGDYLRGKIEPTAAVPGDTSGVDDHTHAASADGHTVTLSSDAVTVQPEVVVVNKVIGVETSEDTTGIAVDTHGNHTHSMVQILSNITAGAGGSTAWAAGPPASWEVTTTENSDLTHKVVEGSGHGHTVDDFTPTTNSHVHTSPIHTHTITSANPHDHAITVTKTTADDHRPLSQSMHMIERIDNSKP
jgi:hypothetical protein